MRYMKTLATLSLLVVISATPAQAQSSSRNSGGGGGSVAPPSFPSAPSSGFSNPGQGFPQQPFPQQTMPFGQGTVSPSFNQGSMPIQGQAPGQNAGGPLGVGASELNDQIWTQHDPNSTLMVDHSTWDYLLSRYLVTGLVSAGTAKIDCQR